MAIHALRNSLREDLLEGQVGAEGKLKVGWVVSHYGAGTSPVREALNRRNQALGGAAVISIR